MNARISTIPDPLPPHPPPSLPRVGVLVSGPLTALARGGDSLVVAAHKIATVSSSLITTELVVSADGRDAHFASFMAPSWSAPDLEPRHFHMWKLENKLFLLKAGHPSHTLEWAITCYGQGNAKPEWARGSYVHGGARP